MADTIKLLEGFKRFQQQYFGDDHRLFDSFQDGQPAKTLMVACCDSRVDPAILTDCDPGDLFIIRNVANLVPPREEAGHYHGTSAALEFAVNNLEVENIIVMGHANCGGIKALWDNDDNSQSKYIQEWVNIAKSAKQSVKEEFADAPREQQIKACEQASILVSLDNLLSFPWIRERLEQGNLSLHGWYFDISAGELLRFNPVSGLFESVTA
ncbi:MAG: carbonic anhydrase [Methylophaga sp.]|nr:MAG: carbonic anhydrase [Methylophaga sp.]